MLHLITEVGKPGKHDFEKRHFNTLSNRPGNTVYKPRGRRYIPHGEGDESQFNPHPHQMAPLYTEHGLDWKSRVRRIPSPHNPKYKPEIWPDPWFSMRTYPGSSNKTTNEWMLYSEGPGYDVTRRCLWNGEHPATSRGEKEITHTELYGKGRNSLIIDKRNGIPTAAPGDKSYQAVEYSTQFHREGSTLPLVNFGGNNKPKADTFVPLQYTTFDASKCFKQKEQSRQHQDEVYDVQNLERWRPASPLQAPSKAKNI